MAVFRGAAKLCLCLYKLAERILVTAAQPRGMTSQRNGQSRERSTLRQPPTGVVFNILPRPRAVVLCVSSGLDRRAMYGWRSLWKGQAVFLSVSGRGRLLRCRARGCWGRWKQAPDVGHACGRRGRCSLLQSRGAADGGSGGYVQCPAAAHSTTSDWMPGPGPRLADQPRFLRTIVTNPRNKQSGNLGKVPGPGVLSLMVVFPKVMMPVSQKLWSTPDLSIH
jgi:hypothetical protein